jgi:hypothetical protein
LPAQYEHLVTADFETYYSSSYSLRSAALSTSSYIRNAEFKPHCLSLKVDDEPARWYIGDAITFALRAIDWKTTALLAHHTPFDGLILSHHYNIVPCYYFDTLSMARALHSNAIGVGLDEVAGFYKVGRKTPDVLARMRGVRDPSEAQLTELAGYCAQDVDLCHGIFQRMLPGFPADELDLIDMTVRMFADPILTLDVPRLKQELEREQVEKARRIALSGVSLTTLSSSEKFAHELICSGVPEPPQKISKTTKKRIWAFSKTDLAFLDLRGHPSERVRNLVDGRLAAKSTLTESRAKRLIDTGRAGGRLPVYLSYFGAHTGRWSGRGDKVNLQNLPRPEFERDGSYIYPSGELRRSICAPPGHVLVVVDSAQIEARVLAWLADDVEQLMLFRSKQDVYKYMAALIYHCTPGDITKDQRFVGKVATLGLGYGMGADRFKLTLALGNMGPPVFVSDAQADHVVRTYRTSRTQVARLWRQLEAVLYSMCRDRDGVLKALRWEGGKRRVHLPNGTYLQYPYLELRNGNYRYYDYKAIIKMKFSVDPEEEDLGKYLHGGVFTENLVQALARIVIGEQMLAIGRQLVEVGDGFFRRIVTMTHDEIVACVPTEEADKTLQMMLGVMRTPPVWAPDVPLDAEGTYAEIYAK